MGVPEIIWKYQIVKQHGKKQEDNASCYFTIYWGGGNGGALPFFFQTIFAYKHLISQAF